ncbi:MAG TPA: hypothetical protein VGC79_24120 [Polyangiaceae bacterium]
MTTWLVLMLFSLVGPVKLQPVKLAVAVTETGKFAVTEIEYAPVVSVLAESVTAPVSLTVAPTNGPPPELVTRPEIEIVPTTADETCSADSPSAGCCPQPATNANAASCAHIRP